MCILDDDINDHPDVTEHILACRDMITRLSNMEAATGFPCCDSDRPEDCGDQACHEARRFDPLGVFGLDFEPCWHPVACGAEIPDYVAHALANTSLDRRG